MHEDVQRLTSRAAAAGMSLSEYVRRVLANSEGRPTPDELAARIADRGEIVRDEPSDITIRRLREHSGD